MTVSKPNHQKIMRVSDKIAPLHHPIFKPANLPDFLAVARTVRIVLIEKAKKALLFVDYGWLKRPARLAGKGNFCAFAKLFGLCSIPDFNRVILESGLSKR